MKNSTENKDDDFAKIHWSIQFFNERTTTKINQKLNDMILNKQIKTSKFPYIFDQPYAITAITKVGKIFKGLKVYLSFVKIFSS